MAAVEDGSSGRRDENDVRRNGSSSGGCYGRWQHWKTMVEEETELVAEGTAKEKEEAAKGGSRRREQSDSIGLWQMKSRRRQQKRQQKSAEEENKEAAEVEGSG